MVVVIPFCEADAALAVKTLRVIEYLNAGKNHDCLLHTPMRDIPEHRAVAYRCFKSVSEHKYDDIYQPAGWPAGANHAFMAALTKMSEQGSPWFWLEPDALPIRPDAFDRIAEDRPDAQLAGVQMLHMAGHPYINGVARYAHDALTLAPTMAFSRTTPFDMAMGGTFTGSRIDQRELIFNFPRAFHLHSHAEDETFLHWLLNTGKVLFHGCTDGSMHDLVMGKRPVKPEGYYVPINHDCLRVPMDRASSFWHWEAARVAATGWTVIKPWRARVETPPFPHQTEFAAGLFNLPHSPLMVHFNPGLVRKPNGNLALVTRQWKRPHVGVGVWDSTLQLFDINEPDMGATHIGQLNMRRDRDKRIQCEDPRVVWNEKRRCFYVMHVVWKKGSKYVAHQRLSVFNEAWQPVSDHNIAFGGNSNQFGGGRHHEKNWSVFFHDEKAMVLYSFSPHVIFSTDGSMPLDVHRTEAPVHLWKYGEIRGGTPPVRVGDHYITFMHSSLWWKNVQKRYYMGAYIFEAKPPFKVLAITEKPILIGTDQDIRTLGGPPCIFPCGADYRDGSWLVTFGVNDEACGWIKIPHHKLIGRMTKC